MASAEHKARHDRGEKTRTLGLRESRPTSVRPIRDPSAGPHTRDWPRPDRLGSVSKPPEQDPAKAYAEALGDLNALSLDDLGADDSLVGVKAGPPGLVSAPGQENSFADARLDAPDPQPLRSGEHAAVKPPPSSLPQPDREPAEPASAEGATSQVGLDLALVEGGAVMVNAKDLARAKKPEPVAEVQGLESRGATGVSAPSFDGPAPAGHVARPRGLFFFDPVSNALAGAGLAALVALVPAWTFASVKGGGDEAQELLEELKVLHQEIEVLEDPERGEGGPQTLEAVTVALEAKANEVDAKASEVDELLSSAHTRFWGVWFGLGLPLGIALSVLRRRAA